MKRIPVVLVAGLSGLCIALAAYFLTDEPPRPEADVAALQQRLAESERLVAELRGRVNDTSAAGADAGLPAAVAHPSSGDGAIPGNADLAAMQARLEALAERIELRLTQLDSQLKRSSIIPMSRQELDAEIAQAQKTLSELQAHADAQHAEVRRLAAGVPEVVTKLPPWEAANDPLYRPYRPYLDAKIKAGYLQKYANDQATKIIGFQLRCS